MNNKMYKHFKDVHYLSNKYFPNDECKVLKNPAWMKDPFKVKDRPTGLNENRVRKHHCYDFKFHISINLSKSAFRGTPFNYVNSFILNMCNLLYVNLFQ